jgi:hypothetical protein
MIEITMNDLLDYYNNKYWYNISNSMIWKFRGRSDTLFKEGKWRKPVIRFLPPPILSEGCVEWEGKEDPNWDYQKFCEEAIEYFSSKK